MVSVFVSMSRVSVCLLTERDKLQQDLAKMDQIVSVFVSVSNVSIYLLTEKTSYSKTWPRWTRLLVCLSVCLMWLYV